jgi:hypothetical protein
VAGASDDAPASPDGSRALAADSPSANKRIDRLLNGRSALAAPARGLAIVAAIALIAVPTVLLVTPAFS